MSYYNYSGYPPYSSFSYPYPPAGFSPDDYKFIYHRSAASNPFRRYRRPSYTSTSYAAPAAYYPAATTYAPAVATASTTYYPSYAQTSFRTAAPVATVTEPLAVPVATSTVLPAATTATVLPATTTVADAPAYYTAAPATSIYTPVPASARYEAAMESDRRAFLNEYYAHAPHQYRYVDPINNTYIR